MKNKNRISRLELGDAHMYCNDCMALLYHFDGHEDQSRPCPHKKKCEEEKERERMQRINW